MAAAEKQAELAWERENGPKFSAFAFASAALVLVLTAIQIIIRGGADDEREAVIQIHENAALFVAGGVVQALAIAGLAGMVFFFRRAIVARLPTTLALLWPLAFIAPVAFLVGSIASSIHRLDQVDRYVDLDRSAQTVDRAKDVISSSEALGNTLLLIALFALAVTFVNLGVNGIRAGLFSKFIGILCVICGIFSLPFFGGAGAGSFIQLFWTVAVGFLLLNKWPTPRGPAWDVVEAIPWPSAAQVREQVAEDRGVAPAPPVPENSSSEGEGSASPPARRRKKKKRR